VGRAFVGTGRDRLVACMVALATTLRSVARPKQLEISACILRVEVMQL